MPSALITGGRKGLGRALALEFASRGWQTFACSRNLQSMYESGVHWFRADVIDTDSVEDLRKLVAKEIGTLDVLVNNAGAGSSGAVLESVSSDEVVHQLQVHCIGALRVTQAFHQLMAAADHPTVANITSRFASVSRSAAGSLDAKGISYGYRIAKAAQNMFTQCLIHDPSLAHVSVVAINPGQLRTDSGVHDAQRSPEEAARAIVELLSQGEFERGALIHAFGEDAFW